MIDSLARYNRLTRGPVREYRDIELAVESGQVPRELNGALLRNGPGQLQVGETWYRHLFDGDGYVQRFTIRDGRVRYTGRYVQTREFRRETAAGRMLYRNFGTNRPGGMWANAFRFHFKNAANTSLLPYGDDLLALWEGGSPYRLDPVTLETRGPWRFGGHLRPRTIVERLMGNGRAFSAHPKYDPSTGDLLNFGVAPGLRQRLLLHRFPASPGAGRPVTRELDLPRLTFIHDFVATEAGHQVFFDVPVAFRLSASFLGLRSPVESIESQPDGATIIRVLTGFDPEAPTEQFETDACYVFHFVNGFERGDELVVDACRMDEFPEADDVRRILWDEEAGRPLYAFLTRFYLNRSSGTVRSERLSDYPMELPSINPRRRGRSYRYAWGIADRPGRETSETLHGVARFDLHAGTTDFLDRYPNFCGEPLFVPRPGDGAEDDGWLLVLTLDVTEEIARLEILDAVSLDPVARLRLPQPVHLGFHGVWSEDPSQG